MKKDELAKLLHEIAYKEVTHNRSVVNQLLYFSMIIIGAFFWLVSNIRENKILGLDPILIIFLLSFCISFIIALIGISISKQFRQENVQWNIINAIEKENAKEVPKTYFYDSYKIYPERYTLMLLIIFVFLVFVNVTIMNYCMLAYFKWSFAAVFSGFVSYVLLGFFAWLFYDTGMTGVTLNDKKS